MATKKKKKLEDLFICMDDDYGENYVAMAKDAIRPEYGADAS